MALKIKVEIEVSNIRTDDSHYSFDFVWKLNGIKMDKEHYDSSYMNGQTRDEWKQTLEDGEALYLALQMIANKDDI